MSSLRLLIPLALVLALHVGARAQGDDDDEDRPSNAERARPTMSREYEKDLDRYPYLLSAAPTINTEFGLFLNRNLVVETGKQPQNESSIAVNPLNPNVIVGSAVDERGAYVYISTDAGHTWRDTTFGNVNTNWRTGNDPSVGFDYEGNVYVMYGAFPAGNSTGESGVYLAKSGDNGLTWTTHIMVIEHKGKMTKDSAFEDKYYVELDNSPTSPRRGYVYTPWKRVIDSDSSTQIVVARSSNRGATWAPPVPVSPRKHGTSLDTTFGQSFPLTATGPDGTLYVVWNDGPIRSIGFAKSTDGGQTFTAPTYPVQGYPTLGTTRLYNRSVYHVLKGTFRAETYPTMTVDRSNSPRRGWIYLAWASGRRPDVSFIRSSDGGASWSTPVVIHSDTAGDQWWPWLSVDQTNGDIAVMYSDSRNDPANILIDTYISYSTDGGSTWIDRRATDYQSDFRKNPFDGIFAGDYSGNAFHAGKIYPSFLDTREDNDVFTALANVRQPYPVENLAARGTATNLQQTTVSWTYTHGLTTTFGLPITSYQFEIRRAGNVIATVPSNTTQWTESGLTVDSTYEYAVSVVAGTERSIDRTVTYKPADAMLPMRPAIITVNAFRPQVELSTRIPTVRADSSTPLSNLAAYRLYRDGQLLREEPLTPGDTGRTISITDVPAERGYYRYTVTIIDGSAPQRESATSDTILTYGGSIDQYTEGFDAVHPRFLYTGTWATTSARALSPPNSATDSPDGDYLPRRSTYMQIFPVKMEGQVELTFAHIAVVDPGDSAVVEASYDRGATWTVVKRYSFSDDPAWADKSADAGDWRQAFITLTHPAPGPDAVGIVRFRLATGVINNADGWYVDDIAFGKPAGVDAGPGATSSRLGARAYPNPAGTAAIIGYDLPSASHVTVRVTDMVGRQVMLLDDRDLEAGPHSVTLDAAALPSGVYLFDVRAGSYGDRGRIVIAH